MKTTAKTLALLLLVGFLGSGCATVSKLNAEYEEELIRVEQMNPEEKAEWETSRQERERINWNEFVGGGEN
jgi:uncharacterized protein YceK